MDIENVSQIDDVEQDKIKYASFDRRMLSFMADMFIIFFFSFPFLRRVDQLVIGERNAQALINEIILEKGAESVNILSVFDKFYEAGFWHKYLLLQAITIGVFFCYMLFFWNRYGATPGKMLFRIRIVDSKTLEHPSLAKLIGRFFAYIPSCLPFLIGFFAIKFTKRNRAWHDMLSGTVVIVDDSEFPLMDKVRKFATNLKAKFSSK